MGILSLCFYGRCHAIESWHAARVLKIGTYRGTGRMYVYTRLFRGTKLEE